MHDAVAVLERRHNILQRLFVGPDFFSRVVNDSDLAAYKDVILVRFEKSHLLLNSVWHRDIVRIKSADVPTTGNFQPAVESSNKSTMLFFKNTNSRVLKCEPAQDRERGIGRTVVYRNNFNVLLCLSECALKGFGKVGLPVIYGDENRSYGIVFVDFNQNAQSLTIYNLFMSSGCSVVALSAC